VTVEVGVLVVGIGVGGGEVTLGEAATTPGGRLVGLTPSGVNWQAVRGMVRKSTVTIQRIQLPHVPVVP
jgi:hypothetical protein